MFERAREEWEGLGLPPNPATVGNLGLAAFMTERPEAAAAYYREALEAAAKFDQAEEVCYALEGLAASLIKCGRSLVQSVQLIGAAAASRRRLGTTIQEGPETEIMRQTRTAASLALGEDAFKEALAQGAKIELNQAVALARSLD